MANPLVRASAAAANAIDGCEKSDAGFDQQRMACPAGRAALRYRLPRLRGEHASARDDIGFGRAPAAYRFW